MVLETRVSQGRYLLLQNIFARFMTMRERRILARAVGIKKKNIGVNHQR